MHAWAVEGDFDPSTLASSTFRMEWPPRSGRSAEFPEIDRADWFARDVARAKIVAGQVLLLEQLDRLLSQSAGG